MTGSSGEEIVAEALLACADRCYAVPGYPVSGIAEKTGAEIVISEKVGMEYALGDSISGRRAAVVMKNVGINACADPLVQAVTQGLRRGVIILAGDDIEAAGSQNAQDSRYYGELAQVPVLEPGPETCFSAVEAAFEASERFSRPAIVRLTPDLLFGTGVADRVRRVDLDGRLADPGLTMKGKTMEAERAFMEMFGWSRESPLNRISGGDLGAGAVQAESRVVTVYPPPATPDLLAGVKELGRP
ncbi:MAG: indolepyruvate ferredoxin oxidoreductase, partial [Methanoregulaceae archaeon]|nr:indolepyruvate ferredoxin oxidoreductase [Methanoregulaceae archaeon]